MTDNMFDKFVRDKLKDHQTAVPAGLWDKIEQRKDKNRKGGLLSRGGLFTSLLLLVIASGILYLSLNNDVNETLSQVNEPIAINKTNDVNGSTIENENEEKNSSTGNNNNQTAENLNPDKRIIAGDDFKSDKANEPTNFLEEDASGKSVNTSTARLVTQNIYSVLSTRNKVKRNSFSTRKNKINDEADLLTTQPNFRLVTETEAQKAPPLTQGKTAYKLMSLGQFDENKNYNLSNLKIAGIDCPPNGRSGRNDWYFEVYGSPDVAFKSVKATSNAGYISKKDSSETPQLSYTAGFRISRSIGENLLMKTGLQYSQINERFDLRTENERRITTVITIRTIIGQSGADSTVRDTTSVEQIGYRVQRTYNRYRSIDIPLLLSYEFGNEKLKFAVNAGAIINLRSWYSGNTLNDSLAVISIDSKSSGIYKQNIGVGLYAGISIIKPVSNRLEVFLEPHFRYNFTNMSKTAGYSQRFNAAGVSFGIRYRINRQRSGIN
jgi:hypothetical protein